MSQSPRSADPSSARSIHPRVERIIHPQPRFRLSLRGRLIIVGVLLVAVMGAAYWYYQATAPARAAEAVAAAGGSVRYAKDDPQSGIIVAVDLNLPQLTDEQLAGMGVDAWHLPHVTQLDLRNAAITDAALDQLAGMQLQTLLLDRTAITDDGLESLLELPSLQSVSLLHTSFGNSGLTYLASLPRLNSLYLSGTRVTAAGLNTLARCRSLRYLQLDASQADGDAVSRLTQALPELTVSVAP